MISNSFSKVHTLANISLVELRNIHCTSSVPWLRIHADM